MVNVPTVGAKKKDNTQAGKQSQQIVKSVGPAAPVGGKLTSAAGKNANAKNNSKPVASASSKNNIPVASASLSTTAPPRPAVTKSSAGVYTGWRNTDIGNVQQQHERFAQSGPSNLDKKDGVSALTLFEQFASRKNISQQLHRQSRAGTSGATLPLSHRYGDEFDTTSEVDEAAEGSGGSVGSGAEDYVDIEVEQDDDEVEEHQGAQQAGQQRPIASAAAGRKKSAKNYSSAENKLLAEVVLVKEAVDKTVKSGAWKAVVETMRRGGYERSASTYQAHHTALMTCVRSAQSYLSAEGIEAPDPTNTNAQWIFPHNDELSDQIQVYTKACCDALWSLKLKSHKWWDTNVVYRLLCTIRVVDADKRNQQDAVGVRETLEINRSKFAAEREGRAERLAAEKAAEEERRERQQQHHQELVDNFAVEAQALQRQADAACTSAAAISAMSTSITAIANGLHQQQHQQHQQEPHHVEQQAAALAALAARMDGVVHTQNEQTNKLNRLLAHFNLL